MAPHARQQRHGDDLAGQGHRDVRHREPSRTANGTKVVASRCVITSSQRWKDASGGHLTGKHSGKCLTDPGTGRNSTQLEIAACKNTAAEHWSLP
jgi:hypothetical protein